MNRRTFLSLLPFVPAALKAAVSEPKLKASDITTVSVPIHEQWGISSGSSYVVGGEYYSDVVWSRVRDLPVHEHTYFPFNMGEVKRG